MGFRPHIGLAVVLVATTASATPHRHHRHHPRSPRAHRASTARVIAAAPSASYFMAADPHVPLAVVAGSTIQEAVASAERGHTCGSPSRWRVPASRWNAVDAWGQVVGTFTVADFDDYDVTACAEATFGAAPRNDNALVYVSADSAWRPAPPVKWAPSAAEARAFDAVLSDVARGHLQKNLSRECTEVGDETRYFDVTVGGSVQHLAVGGRAGGFVVATLNGTTWTREFVKTEPIVPGAPAMCYRPVAVFDMNGDGIAEIVMRQAEPNSWSDFVLTRTPSGHWRNVAESPGGSNL
jgi:hypothetical protein